MTKTKLEKVVQKEIIQYVKANDNWVIKVIVANENGCPDLIISWEGYFIGCEVKAERFAAAPEKQLSSQQKRQLARIDERGGVSCCVATLDQFKEVIRNLSLIK